MDDGQVQAINLPSSPQSQKDGMRISRVKQTDEKGVKKKPKFQDKIEESEHDTVSHPVNSKTDKKLEDENKPVKLEEIKKNVEHKADPQREDSSSSDSEDVNHQTEMIDKQNILENFKNIKNCVQPFKEIMFEELKELKKKKFLQTNKRSKVEDDDGNNLQVADIHEPQKKLIEMLKSKKGDNKDREKAKNEEQRLMINNYTNTDIQKMVYDVGQKRKQFEANVLPEMLMLNIMLLRDDIDCAGRRVYSLFFHEEDATLDNLKEKIYQYFGYERESVFFYCFNNKFDKAELKDKSIFTYMNEKMSSVKEHVVYMLMVITTCKVPKYARQFFPLKSHVEIDLNSIMNYSNIYESLNYVDQIFNRNIYKEQELKQILRSNKYKYKETNDFESGLPICEIDYNDIALVITSADDPVVYYELKLDKDVPYYLQQEDYTVPFKGIDQLKILLGEERGSDYIHYHDFLIKNIVWNRQRLQSTYAFFEDTYKRDISFEYVMETDIYSVFKKNDLLMLDHLRKFEQSCFLYCTRILEGKLVPEPRTNIVFNDQVIRYLVDGIIIEAIQPPRACINHSIRHKNHVKKLYKNQIKIWEQLKDTQDIYIPFYCLVEVYGNFYFCYNNCDLGSLSMFYGSSSGGMLFEVVDDQANDIAKKIADLLNISTHKIYDYSMLDTKNINLACNTEIHRMLYSYDNTDYFYYFPRVCDRVMPPDFNWIYQNMLSHDSYLGNFMLLRPELVMNHHNDQVKEGWIVCKWKEFIKCDYCKTTIYADAFFQYVKDKDEYKTSFKQRKYCVQCYEKFKFRFDVPHDKLALKTIGKKQSEPPYYFNLETKEKRMDPPYTFIKTNPDVLFFYDSIYSEREMITEQIGNEEFLKMINENEAERDQIKILSKKLLEENMDYFIDLFERGEIFLQVNSLNFVEFLHQYALNVRYMVVLFERTKSVILKELLVIEIMCRVLKEILFKRVNENQIVISSSNIKYYHNEFIQVVVDMVKDLYNMFDLQIDADIELAQYLANLSPSQRAMYEEMKEVCKEKYKAPVEFYRQEFNFQNLVYVFLTKYQIQVVDEFWLDQNYEQKYEQFSITQIISFNNICSLYKYESLYVHYFIEFLSRMNGMIHKSLVEEKKYLFYLDWYRHFFEEMQKMYDPSHSVYVTVAMNYCASLISYHNRGCTGIVDWNQVQRIVWSEQLEEVLCILSETLAARVNLNCLISAQSLDLLNVYADINYVRSTVKLPCEVHPSLQKYLLIFNEESTYLKILMFNQYLSEVINGIYNIKICEILLKIAQAMYECDRCEEASFLARKFMYSIAISYEEEHLIYKHFVSKFNKIEYKVDSGYEQLTRIQLIDTLTNILNHSDSMSNSQLDNERNLDENNAQDNQSIDNQDLDRDIDRDEQD